MSRRTARFGLGRNRERGSVLIIVIWICLGLVALTLYFADSMSSELRAADNRSVETEARLAVAGGTRYAAYVLSQFATNGAVPRWEEYQAEALPVGEATFWMIGRDPNQIPTTEPVFGLVDEASKLNINTATRGMLEMLPGITPELVEALLGWKRAAGEGGTDDNLYSRLDPPRRGKGGLFESADELRLVYGASLEILFGEDSNRNGVLDANEDDSDRSAPRDNQDGQLLAGIAEHITVYSRQPVAGKNIGRRINISTAQSRQRLGGLLQRLLTPQRGQEIMQRIGNQTLRSVAEFMVRGELTPEEFALVRNDLSAADAPVRGLINVNTASETVLACIPGIGVENAPALVAYRLAHPDLMTSFAWLTEVLDPPSIILAGRYLTDQSYQFSADIAAVGHFGRGYARAKTIFDMSTGVPRIVYHQDLAPYGWALGAHVRESLRRSRETGI